MEKIRYEAINDIGGMVQVDGKSPPHNQTMAGIQAGREKCWHTVFPIHNNLSQVALNIKTPNTDKSNETH